MHIHIDHLKKHFGHTRAVDDVSFSFSSGEIIGFVGPNGAGKSTTMRIIATLDEPTSGDVFLDDISVVQEPEKAHRLIGYVPDALPSHRDISVHEYLDFFARAYGIAAAPRRKVVESIEEFTNLLGIRDKHVNALSKGMKNRVSVARALVHDPTVLIMDEPAAGLDPRARIELRELLKVLSSQGKAILISSHILTELAEICSGAVIIERGTILRAGSLSRILTADLPHRSIRIRTLDEPELLHKHLILQPNIAAVRLIDHTVEADVTGDDESCWELLAHLVRGGYRVVEFHQQRAGLEELFMNVTEGEVQ
ncbi:MAG: ABC transporter ATP-binding protein [Gemmataceae bacterium]